MADDFVRVNFNGTRRKIRFKHKDLRDAVNASGKSIQQLISDPFGGWPYLLVFGLRASDPTMSLDKASILMDTWVEEPDPETKLERALDQLQEVLIQAITASKFVSLKPELSDDGPEGNDKPEAGDRTATSTTSGST